MGSRVTIDGDARTLLQEMEKISKANVKLQREYKEQADETKRLSRVAEQAMRAIITPTEKYNAKLKDLQAALKSGKLDQEQYNRAVGRVEGEYRKAQLGAENAFSPRILANIGQFATGIFGISAATSGFVDALREARDAGREIAQQIDQSAASSGLLQQVAQGGTFAAKQADFVQLTEQARGLRAAGAATSLDEANRIRFAVRSASLDQDLPTFEKLGAAKLADDIPGLINALSAVTTGFKEQAGNTEQQISQLLAASGVSPANISEIAAAAVTVATSGKPLGLTFQESLAATANVSALTGRPDLAKTETQAFFNAVDKQGITAESLTGLIGSLNKRVESGEDIRDVLGADINALKGFRDLTTLYRSGALQENLANIERARSGEAFREAVRLNQSDPGLFTKITQEREEGALEVQNYLEGAREQQRDAVNKRIERLNRELGVDFLQRYIGGRARAGLEFFGVEPGGLGTATIFEAQARAGGRSDLLPMIDELRKMHGYLLQIDRSINNRTAPVPVPETAGGNQ